MYAASFLTDAALGGLNYQIEHHLFPSMPRPNLRHAQRLVRGFCDSHEVAYLGDRSDPFVLPGDPASQRGRTGDPSRLNRLRSEP